MENFLHLRKRTEDRDSGKSNKKGLYQIMDTDLFFIPLFPHLIFESDRKKVMEKEYFQRSR